MSRPQRTTSKPQPDAGFSLLEMLVALALLAAMLAMVPATMRMAARAWQAQDGMDRSASIASARAMLAERLEQVVPVAAGGATADPLLAFTGEPNSLRFVAPPPRSAAASGLLAYTLHLDAAAGGKRRHLAIDTAPHAGTHPPASVAASRPASRHVLVEDVGALSLRYFGRPAEGAAQPAWQPRWSGRARLPELIEVSFDIAAANGRRTERMLVVPRLGPAR
jgi:general secretion pathway protein J